MVGRQAEAKDFIWSIRSPGHVRECVIVWCVGNFTMRDLCVDSNQNKTSLYLLRVGAAIPLQRVADMIGWEAKLKSGRLGKLKAAAFRRRRFSPY